MANPATIRTNLAARLRSISGSPGLTVYDKWPNQIAGLPAIIVGRGEAEPEQTFGRGDLTKWDWEVHVLVGLQPGYEIAQDTLDPLIATSSTGGVYGALHADRTLGGTVDTLFVKSFGPDEQVEIQEAIAYQGYMASVEIWAA